jgi:hypothetical protein
MKWEPGIRAWSSHRWCSPGCSWTEASFAGTWQTNVDLWIRGRCCDHNFLRFLPIFGEKMAFFSKTNVMIKFLHNIALFWVKKRQFFRNFFRRKYFKYHNIGPWSQSWQMLICEYGFATQLFGKYYLSLIGQHSKQIWTHCFSVVTCDKVSYYRSQSYDRELHRQRCM